LSRFKANPLRLLLSVVDYSDFIEGFKSVSFVHFLSFVVSQAEGRFPKFLATFLRRLGDPSLTLSSQIKVS
jgi:hypothetical protein